jgi:hypothetical protein
MPGGCVYVPGAAWLQRYALTGLALPWGERQ